MRLPSPLTFFLTPKARTPKTRLMVIIWCVSILCSVFIPAVAAKLFFSHRLRNEIFHWSYRVPIDIEKKDLRDNFERNAYFNLVRQIAFRSADPQYKSLIIIESAKNDTNIAVLWSDGSFMQYGPNDANAHNLYRFDSARYLGLAYWLISNLKNKKPDTSASEFPVCAPGYGYCIYLRSDDEFSLYKTPFPKQTTCCCKYDCTAQDSIIDKLNIEGRICDAFLDYVDNTNDIPIDSSAAGRFVYGVFNMRTIEMFSAPSVWIWNSVIKQHMPNKGKFTLQSSTNI